MERYYEDHLTLYYGSIQSIDYELHPSHLYDPSSPLYNPLYDPSLPQYIYASILENIPNTLPTLTCANDQLTLLHPLHDSFSTLNCVDELSIQPSFAEFIINIKL